MTALTFSELLDTIVDSQYWATVAENLSIDDIVEALEASEEGHE